MILVTVSCIKCLCSTLDMLPYLSHVSKIISMTELSHTWTHYQVMFPRMTNFTVFLCVFKSSSISHVLFSPQ